MWKKVAEKFEKYPSQIAVAREFLRLGISVKNGKAYCDEIELVPTKIAEAIGVDRKVVLAAIQNIESDEELRKVFSALKPVANIAEVARILGFGVVEVYAESHKVGIVAGVASALANAGISIRYRRNPSYRSTRPVFVTTLTTPPKEPYSAANPPLIT